MAGEGLVLERSPLFFFSERDGDSRASTGFFFHRVLCYRVAESLCCTGLFFSAFPRAPIALYTLFLVQASRFLGSLFIGDGVLLFMGRELFAIPGRFLFLVPPWAIEHIRLINPHRLRGVIRSCFSLVLF